MSEGDVSDGDFADYYYGDPPIDDEPNDDPGAAPDGEAPDANADGDAAERDADADADSAASDVSGDSDDSARSDRTPASHKAGTIRARPGPAHKAADVLTPLAEREVIAVVGADRVTGDQLTQAEAAYIIAMRAEQIAANATHFATDAGDEHDCVAIASAELFDRRCPLLVRREVGVGARGEIYVEYWDPKEMALPQSADVARRTRINV